MSKNRSHLLLSILFLLSSVALWSKVAPNPPAPAPEPAICQSNSSVNVEQVTGVWEQYAVEHGRRHFMARLEICAADSDYMAYPLALSQFTYPKHAYRSYDHVKQDGVWTFKEEWDHGNIGEFVLVQQPNGDYLGVATSLADGHRFETVFVRVK